MRLVLDTVVIIRALLDPACRSGRILFEHFRDYEWIVSQAIVAEYLEVTSRPAITSKLARRNRSKAGFLDLLGRATVVSPAAIPAMCRDPGDDKFLAAALAGNADYIVSEDLDLLSLSKYEGIVICNSQTMIELLIEADGR
jgi:putative PIN family toxin of toxin-antitoxin system